MMHQRKGKKVLIYFFLLLLVASINNINLNNFKISSVKNINVSGLNEINNNNILKSIENLNLKNIFLLNVSALKNIFETNNLIENYKIFKKYPSTLYVDIKQTKFLAKITNDGKIFLIGSNGKLSKDIFSNQELPFIFGNPDTEAFLQFKSIIDRSKFSYDEIENLYFFPSERWDLKLKKNNIILKLPNNNIIEALDYAFEFLNNEKFENIKIIDARIKNQIILNE